MKLTGWITGIIFTFLFIAFLFLSGLVRTSVPGLEVISAAAQSSVNQGDFSPGNGQELKKNYGINERDTDGIFYLSPKTQMDASEILILKLKNPADGEKLMASAGKRAVKRADMFRSYKPGEALILDNSINEVKSGFFIFIAHKSADEIMSSIEKSMR